MFARSSSYQGDPSTLDAGIAFVRNDVMPVLGEIHACLGLSLMVDRDGGECIATSAWRTEEAMYRNMENLTPLRHRLGDVLGCPPRIEEWEIVDVHRERPTPEGSCCRVTWFRTDHANVDRGVDVFRLGVMPRLEALDGFCSASLMVNRTSSRACATVCYQDEDSLAASADQAWALRDAGVRDAGVDVVDVGEYELVLAHLRVPEMAGGSRPLRR